MLSKSFLINNIWVITFRNHCNFFHTYTKTNTNSNIVPTHAVVVVLLCAHQACIGCSQKWPIFEGLSHTNTYTHTTHPEKPTQPTRLHTHSTARMQLRHRAAGSRRSITVCELCGCASSFCGHPKTFVGARVFCVSVVELSILVFDSVRCVFCIDKVYRVFGLTRVIGLSRGGTNNCWLRSSAPHSFDREMEYSRSLLMMGNTHCIRNQPNFGQTKKAIKLTFLIQ